MSRGHIHGVVVAFVTALTLAQLHATGAANESPAILQRFFALDDPTPSQFRALRHLEARNEKFEKSAWMDVWTEGDASGFRYEIIAEEGSEYIRSKVLRASLEAERKMWASGEPDRAALTRDNYTFGARDADADGLKSVAMKPKRKDLLLVDGTIFLNPDDGELMRMEGRLSKSPSFWTRHVRIVRWYRRFAGVRMPVALETVANVRIAGESTFRMTYEYESINGQRIGTPQARARR